MMQMDAEVWEALHQQIFSQGKNLWEITEEFQAREWHDPIHAVHKEDYSVSETKNKLQKTKNCLGSCFRIQERNIKGSN